MSTLDKIDTKIFLPGIDGNASSDGTNGDAEKAWANGTAPTVDPETATGISAPDESAKYAGNVAGWSQSDAYGNNEYAYEVARNSMNQGTSGINPFHSDDFTRMLYMEQQGAGSIFFGLA